MSTYQTGALENYHNRIFGDYGELTMDLIFLVKLPNLPEGWRRRVRLLAPTVIIG